jgi:hypothetical protein
MHDRILSQLRDPNALDTSPLIQGEGINAEAHTRRTIHEVAISSSKVTVMLPLDFHPAAQCFLSNRGPEIQAWSCVDLG